MGARSSCGVGNERGGKYVDLVVWLEDGAPDKVMLQTRWCSRQGGAPEKGGLHLERCFPLS